MHFLIIHFPAFSSADNKRHRLQDDGNDGTQESAEHPQPTAPADADLTVCGECPESQAGRHSHADRGGAHICHLQSALPCTKDVAVLVSGGCAEGGLIECLGSGTPTGFFILFTLFS